MTLGLVLHWVIENIFALLTIIFFLLIHPNIKQKTL